MSVAPVQAKDDPARKLLALVVDDSVIDLKLASSLLQNLGGWDVKTASNGVEAMKSLEGGTPDVVLTDLQMPEMDGLQLVQAIRANYPSVPVILMTAHGSEEIAIQALRSGAASYVPKKNLAKNLAATLDQIQSATKANRDQRRLIEFQSQFEAQFVLDNDSTLIPPLVSHLEDNLLRMGLCETGGWCCWGWRCTRHCPTPFFTGTWSLVPNCASTRRRSITGRGRPAATRSRTPTAACTCRPG
jgi:CheY-like chemotaxis protein